eukprot:TRINITY_DN2316_c0_g1_i2.p1 TRINITY_DN2316_c0_g1~~TRINITY_DN2316_c0_g1_i2.p1  ORF type:complete len:982 (-),score=206.11 TRINITY_DN2316_c0_g1_i2:40-2985(-)
MGGNDDSTFHCNFTVTIENIYYPDESISKIFRGAVFSRDQEVLGFKRMLDIEYEDFINVSEGYIDPTTNSVTFQLMMVMCEESSSSDDFGSYSSKKQTGYIGIVNQGATCYLNSIIQSLYHIPYFRRAVYSIPTELDDVSSSIPLALQNLFYWLQFDDDAAETEELTRSFGWTEADSFTQHDVQELLRKLIDNLEEKMKKIGMGKKIERIFKGSTFNFIKCLDVDYQSSRKEGFYDISLVVKGCKHILASFDKFCETERMDGENKYSTDDYGMQDADMGILFQKLPPVLQLHLKRFEYDWMRDQYVKVNDKFEYTEVLQLDEYMNEESDSTILQTYYLHGVLVHSGGLNSGHYYAYLKPTLEDRWYRFDDDLVIEVEKEDAIQNNFGGAGGKYSRYKKTSSAYMLIYIRESEREELLRPVENSEIPSHLSEKFQVSKVEKEKERYERLYAHLLVDCRVYMDSFIFGRNYGSNLLYEDEVPIIRVRKDFPIDSIRLTIQEEFRIPIDSIRLWKWSSVVKGKKRNRPTQDLTPHYQKPISTMVKRGALSIYVEVAQSIMNPIFNPSNEYTMLFIKFYDPSTKQVDYIGTMFSYCTESLMNILPRICVWLGLPSNIPLLAYEEVNERKLTILNPFISIDNIPLAHGDILVVQKLVSYSEITEDYEYPTAIEYYDYLSKSLVVNFHPYTDVRRYGFTLELAEDLHLPEVISIVARHLGCNPDNLQLYSEHEHDNSKPSKQPIQNIYGSTPNLENILRPKTSMFYKDIMFYEVFDVSLSEISSRKKLQIIFRNQKNETIKNIKVYLERTDLVDDIFKQLIDQGITLETENKTLRLLAIRNKSRICRIYKAVDSVSDLSSTYTYICEEIPDGELEDHIMICCSKYKSGYGNRTQIVGFPFLLSVPEFGSLKEVKALIQDKFSVEDSNFNRWKFAKISHYCNKLKSYTSRDDDTDFDWSRFSRQQELFGIEEYINRSYGRDSAVKFYN